VLVNLPTPLRVRKYKITTGVWNNFEMSSRIELKKTDKPIPLTGNVKSLSCACTQRCCSNQERRVGIEPRGTAFTDDATATSILIRCPAPPSEPAPRVGKDPHRTANRFWTRRTSASESRFNVIRTFRFSVPRRVYANMRFISASIGVKRFPSGECFFFFFSHSYSFSGQSRLCARRVGIHVTSAKTSNKIHSVRLTSRRSSERDNKHGTLCRQDSRPSSSCSGKLYGDTVVNIVK
jgi:hypothetical protein